MRLTPPYFSYKTVDKCISQNFLKVQFVRQMTPKVGNEAQQSAFRYFHFKQNTNQLRFRLIKCQNLLLCSSFYDSKNTQEIIHLLGHWWVRLLKPLKCFISPDLLESKPVVF